MRGESAAAVAAAAAAAAARPGKRPMRALSAAEKMDAIQRVHEGESKASVARDIGVPESTLRGWCKSEQKIRGMARNSSTPDSEAAHSPASSTSGHPTNNLNAAHNSEDEGVSPPTKRQRTSDMNEAAMFASAQSGDLANGYKATSGEYLSLLNNLISAGSVSPSQGALLAQQLGMFQTAAKQPLSFVENGFQYSSSGSGSGSKAHNKRASTSSAIAPTSHVDSVSKSGASRKSLPPAAEAPLTSLPLSPRRGSSDIGHLQQQQQQQIHNVGQSTPSSSSSAGKRDPKYDPSMLYWIDQQQKFTMGQQNSDSFWQLYTRYGGAALLAAVANLSGAGAAMTSASNVSSSTIDNAQAQQPVESSSTDEVAKSSSSKKYKTQSVRKSPSKARALIDDLVCSINNNNESARRSLNLDAIEEDAIRQQHPQQQQQQQPEAKEDSKEDEKHLSLEEALQHARVFGKWLDNFHDPINSASLVFQFRMMINNLEKKVASPEPANQRRKTSRKSTPQSISQ